VVSVVSVDARDQTTHDDGRYLTARCDKSEFKGYVYDTMIMMCN
jgi:hypothetical protein